MNRLPIVQRELRVSSRRPMTYWGRAGLAALGGGLALWIAWRRGGGATQSLGREAFQILSTVAVLAAVTSALRLTSPSIASEKRDGTLGLLFLTDLTAADI